MPFGADTPTPQLGRPETIHVDSRTVACDGGDGPLGHPRVWLHIDDRADLLPLLLPHLPAERRRRDDGH